MKGPTFFELLRPGMKQDLGSHTFTADEIIAFASQYDPQPFHLSEAGAKDSLFGHLCASGWHTACMWMHKNVACGHGQLLRLTGYEGPPPVFGPSPGVRNIRWPAPVFAGDTITYSSVLTATRKSPRRPGWGLLLSHSQGYNQDNKLVLAMDGAVTLRVD